MNAFSAKATLFSAALLASSSFVTQASAQVSGFGKTSAPIYGGTSGAIKPPTTTAMRGTYADIHKTPDGKACISVSPLAEAQAINPKIFDQIVLVNNICGQAIKVQVCYAQSSDCIIVPLNGYQRLRRILGIASGSTEFSYQYRELY